MNACKNIGILSEKEQKEYTISPCYLLKNRSEDLHICQSCLANIRKEKVPKKSHKNSFKFANFPNYLIQQIKNKCEVPNSSISQHFDEDNEAYERRALQLNRL